MRQVHSVAGQKRFELYILRDERINLRLKIAVTNLVFMQDIKCSENLCTYDLSTSLRACSVV